MKLKIILQYFHLMKKFPKLFLAGTFDHFHVGHQFFLWQGKVMCEEMVVIIARDRTVERIKGKTVTHSEEKRLQRVKQENLPRTIVRLGREDGDFLRTLREEMPDALLLGYDQRFDESTLEALFPNMKVIRVEAYKPHCFKSSKYR